MSAHRSPIVGLMLTLGIVLGCSSDPGAPPGPTAAPVASVTVAPTQGQILVGGTIQYAATLKSSSNATLTGRTVTWASSDNSVATVNAGGIELNLSDSYGQFNILHMNQDGVIR